MAFCSFPPLMLGMLRGGEGNEDCFNLKNSREHLRQTDADGKAELSKVSRAMATNSASTITWFPKLRVHGNPFIFKE